MRVFVDNTISWRIAQALDLLAEGEYRVVALREWSGGDESVEDEDFLPVLKKEGDWIVFTIDRGRQDANWHVWLASGLTVVFLRRGWGTMRLHDFVQRILKCWPRIMHELEGYPYGTCFYLTKTGRLELVPSHRRGRKRG